MQGLEEGSEKFEAVDSRVSNDNSEAVSLLRGETAVRKIVGVR
jgi:hypothetical protein